MSIFKRTGGEDFPDRLKVMISGPPKSGKTSFLATVPNIVIADTEPQANNLQSVAHKNIPYVTVNGTDDLQRLLFVLRDDKMRAQAADQLGMPKIEAVAIDTLDTLQQIMKAERLKEKRQSQFLRDDWGWLKDELANIIRAYTALPLHTFFIVHTKTAELGKGDDTRTIVLPGLQGSIAEDIAGMVGYSLLAFRKQEIREDGSPYTKYWLRAEGDETYTYLGNRAAGRLPDIIEPSFQAVYGAAMAGVRDIQPTVQIQVEVDAPADEAVAPPAPAQNLGQPPAGDDEPVNGAALSHIKKVYDGCGLPFPEDIVKALTMGQARDLVRMWRAVQSDHAEGKVSDAASTPEAEMAGYLRSSGLALPDEPTEATPDQPALLPDINGTVDAVLLYAGDDLTRIQEAFQAESNRPKPRQTLLNALVNRGAKPIADVSAAAIAVADDAVTPEPEPADSLVQADNLLTEGLGAKVIDVQVDGETAPCEECDGPIDDNDIAVLSRSRFGRWLCVSDYITETRKPRS